MMSIRIFPILTIICVTKISLTRSESSMIALKRLLHELTASENYSPYNSHYSPYHHSHKRGINDHKRHHAQDSTNLMNVQTMNLYVKPNKRQREEAEVKEMLRTEDRMCKLTGRCGCSGARCGNKLDTDKMAKEVDWFVDKINNKQLKDDEQQNNNREQEDKDDEKKNENIMFVIDDEKLFAKDIAEKNKEGDLDYLDEDYSVLGKTINEIQNDKDDDSLDLERINIGNNFDVVVLDKSDLEKLSNNEDFVDLTRNDKKRNQNQEIFGKVLEEYKKIISAKGGISRTTTTITPEDLFNEYAAVKKRVLSKALSYIKGRKILSLLKIKHLTLKQRLNLRRLKKKYALGQLNESDAEDAIVQIIFGQDSSSTVLPHEKRSNDIYVPNWMYSKLVEIKKNLRSQAGVKQQNQKVPKRVMPLTLQQKGRMTNKKGKIIPKLVWRRNQDFQKYGIPVDFEVTGLGQIAP